MAGILRTWVPLVGDAYARELIILLLLYILW